MNYSHPIIIDHPHNLTTMPSVRNSLTVKVIIPILFTVLIGASCTRISKAPQRAEYIVKKGDTIESIGREHNTSPRMIQQINEIYDPDDLSPGMRILLPKPPLFKKTKPVTPPTKSAVKTSLVWPSQGTISSGFGVRHGRMHEGLDITKDKGREVKAAGNGVIAFAGVKNGYGKTVIINHGQGVTTLYAHSAKLYVKKGMKIKKGVTISKMGTSGRSSGIHLHFEVRKNNKPQNPLRYLPIR